MAIIIIGIGPAILVGGAVRDTVGAIMGIADLAAGGMVLMVVMFGLRLITMGVTIVLSIDMVIIVLAIPVRVIVHGDHLWVDVQVLDQCHTDTGERKQRSITAWLGHDTRTAVKIGCAL